MNELRQIKKRLSSLKTFFINLFRRIKIFFYNKEISKLEQKVDLLHEKLDLDED